MSSTIIWVWGEGHEGGHADGNSGKGPGVLCRDPSLLLSALPPKSSPLTHPVGTLKAQEATLSLLFEDGGPHSSLGSALLPGIVCRQGAGANSVPTRLDRSRVQVVSGLKVLVV